PDDPDAPPYSGLPFGEQAETHVALVAGGEARGGLPPRIVNTGTQQRQLNMGGFQRDVPLRDAEGLNRAQFNGVQGLSKELAAAQSRLAKVQEMMRDPATPDQQKPDLQP